ncbi:MAG: response regulator [Kiloniellales bacterium]|jgi:two-component system chemotaxis response regulator CheY
MASIDFGMPVLIVDDYKTMLRIIRNLLKQLGFQNIEEASDGNQALKKLRDKRYGLVISDWNMRPMMGMELLRQVRSDAHLDEVPFVMIAAENKAENAKAARRAGANAYLVKPFNAVTLKTNLTSVIGSF